MSLALKEATGKLDSLGRNAAQNDTSKSYRRIILDTIRDIIADLVSVLRQLEPREHFDVYMPPKL